MDQAISKKDVARLLKDARAMSKKSIEEVAAALRRYGYEIAPRSLYNYESGLSQPPVAMFLVLCRIYGIEDVIAAIETGAARRIEVSVQEELLINSFRAASPELQDAALRMLRPEEKKQSPPPEG